LIYSEEYGTILHTSCIVAGCELRARMLAKKRCQEFLLHDLSEKPHLHKKYMSIVMFYVERKLVLYLSSMYLSFVYSNIVEGAL
jgi:hypothetical protein